MTAMPGPYAAGIDAAGGPPTGGRKTLTAGLVMVVTFVAFEALAVATILPVVRDELGGTELYGWAFSAFLLANIVSLTAAGEVADRRGPALPLLVGIGLFACGLLVSGLAGSMAILVAGRALQGLGAGAVPTVAYVAVGRAYAEDERPRIFAYLSSAWVIPGLAGPAAAAGIAELTSWRVVFLGLLAPIAVAVPIILPALRRMGPPAGAHPGSPGRVAWAALLAAGAALALGGVSLLAERRLEGLALVAGGIAISAPPLLRLWPPGAFRLAPGLASLVVGNAALNLGFFGVEAFLPLALADLRDQPPLLAGLALSAASVSWTAATWLVDRRRALRDPGRAVPLGASFIIGGIALLAVATIEPFPPGLVLPAWLAAGFGIGLAYPNFSLALLRVADERSQGAATAAMKTGEYLGPALGAGAGGALIAVGHEGDWQAGATNAVFLAAVAATVMAAIAARRARVGT